jgi:predicted component of type VI protein secretion system
MKAGMLRVSTSSTQRTVADDRTYVVGRGRDCDIVIADGRVSRRHVLLEPGPQGWLARDTSANGMWRDGKRVATADVDADVRLRLGAADGPEIVLSPLRPPAIPPQADPAIDEAATRLAPSAGRIPSGPARRAEPASASAASGADGAGAGEPAARRWLRLIPTMLWLAATGFAVGALIALS